MILVDVRVHRQQEQGEPIVDDGYRILFPVHSVDDPVPAGTEPTVVDDEVGDPRRPAIKCGILGKFSPE